MFLPMVKIPNDGSIDSPVASLEKALSINKMVIL